MFESESKTVGEREAYSHVRGSSSLGCAGRNRYGAPAVLYIFIIAVGGMARAILRSGLPPPRWKRKSKFQISNKSRSTLECSLGR